METYSALLALCAGNSSVTGEFPSQRSVARSIDVFFNLRLNKQLSKQSCGWWFKMPSRSLWRHCNGNGISYTSKTSFFHWTRALGLFLFAEHHLSHTINMWYYRTADMSKRSKNLISISSPHCISLVRLGNKRHHYAIIYVIFQSCVFLVTFKSQKNIL